MSDIGNNIRNLRQNLFIERFKNELTEMQNEDMDAIIIDSRADKLKAIIDQYIPRKKADELSTYIDTITSNVYNKQWSRMSLFHQSHKLKEYVDSIEEDDNTAKQVYNILLEYLNDGKLKSSKVVDYDTKNMMIKNIYGFKYDNQTKKYTYEFK